MTNFFLELWTDLREKRLVPVAIALAAGLVAVPVLLAKPAEEPAPAATPATPAPGAAAAAATGQPLPAALEAAKPLLRTSTLSEFDSENPFEPLRALAKLEDDAGVEPSDAAAGGKTDTAATGGDTGDDTSGGDTGSTGGTTTPPAPPEETEVFTYQAVLELTTASGVRKRAVNRLGILPSEQNPLLVFLGVSADDQGEAVFLVDSTLSQAGEGKCRPSSATCSFLYLTQADGQDEHILTTEDGGDYGIKLIAIRRVPVKESRAPVGGSPRAKGGSAGATADFSAGDAVSDVTATGVSADTATETAEQPVEDAFEGFGFPLFADEEE